MKNSQFFLVSVLNQINCNNLIALRKPNSIKEWNELMIKMVQSNAASGIDELDEITEVLKVRNRRLYQKPINGYVEYYLKYSSLSNSDDPVTA